MNVEDILFILNGNERVDLDELTFAVITGGYTKTPGTGRMQGQIVTLPQPSYWPFDLGEVLVIDKDSGREPFGECRRPGKWSVEYETFDDLDAAWDRRSEVLGPCGVHMATLGGGYLPCTKSKNHDGDHDDREGE